MGKMSESGNLWAFSNLTRNQKKENSWKTIKLVLSPLMSTLRPALKIYKKYLKKYGQP
jgi:hypothetical protein